MNSIKTTLATTALVFMISFPVAADQVILDDLIVDGSACIGQDCVNGESFGFDTIRIKENNLRIRAVDTSSTASFPTNDWQITFNDSSNGGANKFSIDDIDGGRTPFTIEAGAPSHSLYVDSSSRIGMGTNNPVVQLHVKDGNTPTLRLEQDGSSGFTAQTWDVASNEANFFIRDATNGSTLPFRIKPGAPSNSIGIGSTGDVTMNNDVGLGLTFGQNPATGDGLEERLLEVKAPAGGDARVTIDVDDAAGVFGEFLFERGGVATWSIGMDNSQFYIYNYTTNQYVLSINEATGQVTIPNLALTGR